MQFTAETETKQPGHWVERDIAVTSSVCADRVHVGVTVLVQCRGNILE